MTPTCCSYTNNAQWGWRTTEPIAQGLRVVFPPAGEQITLAEAKLHLRVDDDGASPPSHPDDALILDLIVAAREYVENDLGVALVPQTFELVTAGFPPGESVVLPMPPIAALVSVNYLDSGGLPVVMPPTDYTLADWFHPPQLHAVTWPTASTTAPNAVTIRYDAGYNLPGSPSGAQLPKSIKQAMLLLIGHWYENREATNAASASASLTHELPLGVDSLTERYRVRLGIA